MDCGRYRVGGALVVEKGKKERSMQGNTHKETISPKPLAGNMRGAEFCEFLQPLGLEDWNFRVRQACLG